MDEYSKNESTVSESIVNESQELCLPNNYHQLTLNQRRKWAKRAKMSLKEWESRMDSLALQRGLNGSEKTVIKEKRRVMCLCQGVQHQLITNCLGCGNLVCEKQGIGECLFCGNFVENKEQQRRNLSAGLIETPLLLPERRVRALKLSDLQSSELSDAEARAARLLEYERNAIQRTKITDLESDFDYVAAIDDPWLNVIERGLLLKRLLEQREQQDKLQQQKNMVTFDFASKNVIAIDADKQKAMMEPVKSVQETLTDYRQSQARVSRPSEKQYTLQNHKPTFVDTKKASCFSHDNAGNGVIIAQASTSTGDAVENQATMKADAQKESKWVKNLKKHLKKRTINQDNWNDDLLN